jgi:hypothetical protein
MKTALALLFCLGLAGLARAADPAIPSGTTAERYQPIWVRSPFTLATPNAAESATWVLTGLAEDGDAPIVFLMNRNNQERMSVMTKANEKGFAIDSISYNANPLLSTVKVKTPAETMTLRFDPAQMTVANAAPAPGVPGFNAGPNGGLRPGFPGGVRPGMPRLPVTRTTIPNPIAPNTPPAAPVPSIPPASPAPSTPPPSNP